VVSWHSYSNVVGPLVAFSVVGVLALLLRWAFGHGGSLVRAPARPGHPDEYGLLVSVSAPATEDVGEDIRQRLADNGVRATMTKTQDGLRVMVFRSDLARARALLDRR
jgi:hypothetical protein